MMRCDRIRLATTWLADEMQKDTPPPLIAPAEAGNIADEQIADLRNWLENRWECHPARYGGSEEASRHHSLAEPSSRNAPKPPPYLLAIVVATHHAFFGRVDLMVIGGFSLATGLNAKA